MCFLDDDDMECFVVFVYSGVIIVCEILLNSIYLIICDNIGEVYCYDYLFCAFFYKSWFSCLVMVFINVFLNVNEDGRCIVVGFVDGVVCVFVRNTFFWRLVFAFKLYAYVVE